MATVRIQDEDRTITDADEIVAYLRPFGLRYEHWGVEGRLDGEATDEQVLATYAPEIERLKSECGFVTADVINVTPETPNLDAMLQKFNKEHTHAEDEVRFTVRGQGVFHIHAPHRETGEHHVFAVHVEPGDLLSVPEGTKHWFDLCDDRTIRCIRLFEDPGGWTPEYIEGSTLHENYLPVCMGPAFLDGRGPVDGGLVDDGIDL
ncbi:MAG: acireductone dioxygenase [Planctomycetota bacterium]